MHNVRRIKKEALRVTIIALAVSFGLLAILGLGILGLWLSVWSWVSYVLFALVTLVLVHGVMSGRIFEILSVYVVVCLALAVPVYGISSTILYQNIAQSITTPRNMSYFRDVLEKIALTKNLFNGRALR
jgi:asparagine N-glycosylation enzyme membrane subunit Stt3